MKKQERCESCVFRAESHTHRCDYARLTGRTRKGQPPEDCTYYIKGKRLENQEQTAQFLGKPAKQKEPKQQKQKKQQKKYDWDRAAELYRAGANDTEIARAIGSCSTSVYRWRRKIGLPANVPPGWQNGKRE